MIDLITIQITTKDAELFKVFMEHYDAVEFMIRDGVFNIKQGSAKLNFDKKGFLQSIDKHFFIHYSDRTEDSYYDTLLPS